MSYPHGLFYLLKKQYSQFLLLFYLHCPQFYFCFTFMQYINLVEANYSENYFRLECIFG
jgi:hypothetical protein